MRTIRRRIVFVAYIGLFAWLLAGCSQTSEPVLPKAQQGVLDLRQWSFQNDGSVPLEGEWTFYTSRLLLPEQAAPAGDGRTVRMPGSWNSEPEAYGIKAGEGFGTYRLTVLVRPDEHVLALRIPSILSAYKLWINGDLVASEGEVGQSRETSKPEQYPRIVSFGGKTDKLELTIQVSNFYHRIGGMRTGFLLGESDPVVGGQLRSTVENMIILGSLFIVGLYHVGLYAFRRRESFTIHFGMLCLLVAARNGVTGDAYLIQLFDLPWAPAIKLEYLSFALSAVAGFMYVYRLFPLEVSKWAARAVIGIGVALSLFVLSSPSIAFTRMLPLFQLFVLGVSLYALAVLVFACMRRRDGSFFVLTGVAVFVVAILHDIFLYNEWYGTKQMVPLGLFFFILMQSFIISSRFSSALNRVETVSSELRELNAHLEERIEERTETLRRTNETLELTNAELAKMETSRRHLMTNISHDLRTPITLLQGYLEAMRDGVVRTEEQQQKYVRMMLGKVGGLNRLIGDLFELAKLEAGQFQFDFMPISAKKWMERLCDQYEIDVRSAGIAFDCTFRSGNGPAAPIGPQAVVLRLDLARMDRVIANLVYNAVKHTKAGGKITLSFAYERQTGRITLRIDDTGSGIEAEHLPYIFDRFYMKDRSRNSAQGGSGLGLAIAKEIVEAHGGTIGADSIPGEGTSIRIVLPAKLTL
ncbi:sensor histidine kinase [Paenibacillus humicola]|uniref:sensor histidine kinase n=1 Tax=Paenibacillus humicola TaxID=3110540 RepID=UPI00237B86F7|nr:ATP-binding protein [Paenibacillus humicola]